MLNRSSRSSLLDRRSRIALMLWCVLAFLVWNVVFDRVLVLAGRRFVHEASVVARQGGDYLLIDGHMRSAVVNGFRLANVSAAAILILAFVAIRGARRRSDRYAGF
jgi:hypothetical protein